MNYKVGTAETLPVDDEQKTGLRRGGGSGSGGGNNNGKRGGGGGGGGDRRDNDNQPEHEEAFNPQKYFLGMWIALLVILMTFAGLISTYVFIALNKNQEWQPFNLPVQIVISTLIILASSVTYEFAKHSIIKGDQKRFWTWLMVTTGLGATFISSQIFAWFELAQSGIYVAGNPYAGFFYILTAAHAVHLVGGIVALGYLVLRARRPTYNPENLLKRQTAARVVGLYWHSMDGLWLVLFGLLAFWK